MNAPSPTARPFLFIVIVAINVAVYLLQQFAPGGEPPNPLLDMIKRGANVAPLTLTGEPVRLLTSMFLHAGLLHLALNMYMLLAFGGVAEKAFGAIRFLIVYLLSGLAGGLLSALWYAHRALSHVVIVNGDVVKREQLDLVVSVGASGALMGIAGASLAHWLVVDRHNDQPEARNMRSALLQTIGLTLLMGFVLPGVDNAAHIGGLLAGTIIGALLALAGLGRHVVVRALAGAAVCGAGLLVLAAGLRAPPPPGLLQLRAELVEEIDASNQAQGRSTD